jgi:hypothetical protein
MVNNRKEVIRRYQRKPEFKEYKRKYHLDKVKSKISNIALEQSKDRKTQDFVNEILNLDTTKEVRDKAKEFFGSQYSTLIK